ncbi:MAG: hypothetical protein ABIU05_14535 [Nitrospirales bacterium]
MLRQPSEIEVYRDRAGCHHPPTQEATAVKRWRSAQRVTGRVTSVPVRNRFGMVDHWRRHVVDW